MEHVDQKKGEEKFQATQPDLATALAFSKTGFTVSGKPFGSKASGASQEELTWLQVDNPGIPDPADSNNEKGLRHEIEATRTR